MLHASARLPACLQARDVMGRSALHYAAARGCSEIAEDLMSRGLLAHELDKQKNTPLHLASEYAARCALGVKRIATATFNWSAMHGG